MRRIGLFGGSFDPVHIAHLALAREALAALQLDDLRWIPVGQAWQKTRRMTAPEHREAMLLLAMAGESRFVLERCELEREGPSFTLATVRELQAAQADALWFLIIGQDQFESFHTWHGWQELLGLVTLAVAQRPGAMSSADPEVLRAPHVALALPPMQVSASEIRARVAAGRAVGDLVPPAVARYIARHHLYTGDTQELNGHS